MFDFKEMMERAQGMQKQLSSDLESMVVEASSGGGAVRVVVNGHKELTKLDLSPAAVGDADMLADLIQAALNRAYEDVNNQLKQRFGSAMAGIDPSMISKMFGA